MCLTLAALGCHGSAPAPRSTASLTFAAEGNSVNELTLSQMESLAPPVEVTVMDPLYHHQKRFAALPLSTLLEAAFPGSWKPLASHDFLLRARDGFSIPISGARLLEPGALLAYRDLDLPNWEPVGPTHANPAPFYLIWTGPNQQMTEDYPRPYQLARIEIATVEQVFPNAVPKGAASDSAAARGFATFRARCIACHAVNQEGGRVGPDLNVPQSIVEYRPAAQIKAYIHDPMQFRYGHMPPHPDLTENNLDDLLAYFEFMKSHKHDPNVVPKAAK